VNDDIALYHGHHPACPATSTDPEPCECGAFSIDAAWADAEAALPEGWAITVLSTFTTPHEYLVSAMNRRDGLRATEGLPTEDEPVVVERDGLASALRDLTQKLLAQGRKQS
jgi:hypothetical protein